MSRTSRRALAALGALVLSLAGCDDVLLFDVDAQGRIICAVDADGRVAAVGQSGLRRHLVRLDPVTGQVDRLSAQPQPISWPRACGDQVVLIAGRRRLVQVGPRGARKLLESELLLLQPTPSPTGDRVAVLEAARLGEPGTLRVIHTASRVEADEPIEGALLGFAWAGDGLVVARLAGQGGAANALGRPDARPFAGGEGEILYVRGRERRVLHRGLLGGTTWIAPGNDAVTCVLPRKGDPSAYGLLRVDLDGRGREWGEAVEAHDLWPSADASGRLLFTRSVPDRPTLEGELRLTSLATIGASQRVVTRGPVVAPRRVKGDLVAYLTPGDRLVTQATDGSQLVDWTEALRSALALEAGQ